MGSRTECRGHLQSLKSLLLDSYSSGCPPVEENKATVNVSLDVHIAAILDLNAVNQVLSSVVYMSLTWQDPALAWNVTDWQDVDLISLQAGEVWTPQLVLVNNVGDNLVVSSYDSVHVDWQGNLIASVFMKLETTCEIDVSIYPFDVQNCRIMVAPSYHSRVTFTGTSLTLTFMNVTYISGEWELKAANSHVNQELLEIHLQLSRQWRFYTLTIILPIVLLSLTGACGFLLPPQCGEKVSFQVAIMVSLTLYLNFINDAMPKTSTKLCGFAIYVDLLLLHSCLAFLATLTVLSGQHQLAKLDRDTKVVMIQEPESATTISRDDFVASAPRTHLETVRTAGREWVNKLRQCVRRWYCCCCCLPPESLDKFFFFFFFSTAAGLPTGLYMLFVKM